MPLRLVANCRRSARRACSSRSSPIPAPLATEREAAQRTTDRVELVWTGPELTASASRDTGVAVRELFSVAQHDVYVAGFAVHNGR
jgi:hypothetical protein